MPADKKNQGSEGDYKKKGSIVEQFKNHNLSLNENSIMRSLKMVSTVLVSLLCLFVFVKIINEVKTHNTIGEMPKSPYAITVTGKGEIEVKRDTAVFTFTARAEGKTVALAQSKSAEMNNKALQVIRDQGVAEADIETISYATYPIYDQKVKPCEISATSMSDDTDGGMEPQVARVTPVAPCNTYEQVVKGYETVQVVQVKIREIDQNPTRSGEIIGALGPVGVQVGSLDNKIDNIDELKSQAKQQAIMNARLEAQKTAQALGVKLGEVISFYEENLMGYGGDSGMMESAMVSKSYTSPELPAGEGKVKSSVSVSFEIR